MAIYLITYLELSLRALTALTCFFNISIRRFQGCTKHSS